jgi:hypothetical protein
MIELDRVRRKKMLSYVQLNNENCKYPVVAKVARLLGAIEFNSLFIPSLDFII